ncbi:4Fe-4S binding protein [Nitrogeniibacter aestuarii]|uniref:4Fe-4S binding protein n=1 Tax=Nitrogeniibacter aestuarii TaxID=2815343 RepID=UPI001D0FE977|nr:4Fe-4S binding protein [Nitrogeniibacter aestuarii]
MREHHRSPFFCRLNRPRNVRPLVRLLWLAAVLFGALQSHILVAGELSTEQVAERIHAPLHVLPRLPDLPAWPLSHAFDTEADNGPFGYVFESVDLAPQPGFDGTPLNLLVAIDRRGNFLGVEVISQHEPMFRGGIGEAPLHQFVTQYAGLNLTEQIIIASPGNLSGPRPEVAGQVTLDGVAKATASIRIVNQSVLTAALTVAREKLGFAGAASTRAPAVPDPAAFERLDFAQLLERGWIGHLHLSNAQVEALFADTPAAGLDAVAKARPDDTFADMYLAYLNAPTIGRAILGDTRYAHMMERNFANRHLWWVGIKGRYALFDDAFIPATVPPRLTLAQNGLPFELRDLDFRDRDYNPPTIAGAPHFDSAMTLSSLTEGGVDPGRPLSLDLNIIREFGSVMRERAQRGATLAYTPPEALFIYPPEPLPAWLESWRQRTAELLTISLGLGVLCVLLIAHRRSSINDRRLLWIRNAYLLFTLVFIGWYAQGQLSIVQINGLVRALVAGQGLASFLYDPVTLLLIAFTLMTFFIWGRGTFCGWLCPFGALQEFVGQLARALRMPRLKLALRTRRRLGLLRYVALALIVGAAFVAPRQADLIAEIEPFKTVITTGFDRAWPYLGWAIVTLLCGAFYYKAFCRFLCPLGAAMSLGGRLRLFDWLPRRSECGTPCQSCRHKCAYDAIEPQGSIRYQDCFQCLDCVGIYHDEQRCAPLLLYRKKGRRMHVQDTSTPV